jgi:hypothetical protein
VQYKVLYDFIAQHVSEASVKAGDVITVVETAEDGWFTMLTNDARKVIERAIDKSVHLSSTGTKSSKIGKGLLTLSIFQTGLVPGSYLEKYDDKEEVSLTGRVHQGRFDLFCPTQARHLLIFFIL